MNDHTDLHALAARLTSWFEQRLREVMPPPRHGVLLYGLEVIDPDGVAVLHPDAVRTVLVHEAADECSLLAAPEARRAFDFDAVAIVEHVWIPAGAPGRPGSFPGRRRELRVEVVAVRQ